MYEQDEDDEAHYIDSHVNDNGIKDNTSNVVVGEKVINEVAREDIEVMNENNGDEDNLNAEVEASAVEVKETLEVACEAIEAIDI